MFPDSEQGPVERFLRSFRDGISSSAFASGFVRNFSLVNLKIEKVRVPWLGKGSQAPAQAYRKAIDDYLASADSVPDAGIVILLDEHAKLPDAVNPYLHAKSSLLTAGVPVQELRVPTIKQADTSLSYTLRNIALALYAKMGGTPWTVDQDMTISDELVIGMGSCALAESRFIERERYVGITTVFRGDGSYLLGNISKECPYREYPQVLESETISVLNEIKYRNGWRPGDTVRIIFHTYKPLKNIEVEAIAAKCVQAISGEQNIEFAFLTISHDHPFRLFDIDQQGIKGTKGIYVPQRGIIMQLGRYTRLLCTTGPELVKREGLPLPAPLLVHLHPASTYRSLDYLAEQVLKFTALSWRSTLPAPKPVTIFYSDLIAQFLGRLQRIPDWSPATLNAKLRASRWFL